MKGASADDEEEPASGTSQSSDFPPTAWSMLLQAQGDVPAAAHRAWEALARSYWQPLYAFLRRRGIDHHTAADDIQGFFAHLLSRDFLRRVERGNGLFRSFLLTSLQHWRADRHRAAQAQKRGDGAAHLSLQEMELAGSTLPASSASPEEAFDRRWARSAYDNALSALQDRLQARGRGPQFLHLQGLFNGQGTAPYHEIATSLGMSEGAVKQAALELRREFGLVLRAEVSRTVATAGQVDGEIRYLLQLLRG